MTMNENQQARRLFPLIKTHSRQKPSKRRHWKNAPDRFNANKHLSSATSSWSMTQQQDWLAQQENRKNHVNEFVSIMFSPLCCWVNAPSFLWIINLHFHCWIAAFCEWKRWMIKHERLASQKKGPSCNFKQPITEHITRFFLMQIVALMDKRSKSQN